MKKVFLNLGLLALTAVNAGAVDVKTVRTAGPYMVQQPVIIDSVDAAQHRFSADVLLDTPLNLDAAKSGAISNVEGDFGRVADKDATKKDVQLMLASFSFKASSYSSVEVKVNGPRLYKVYVNGKEKSGKQGYAPGQYDAVIKYVPDTTALSISLDSDKDSLITVLDPAEADKNGNKRAFSMSDLMHMKHYNSVAVSPSGKYYIIGTTWFDTNGRNQFKTEVRDASGKSVFSSSSRISWMPKSDKFMVTRNEDNHINLYAIDPVNLKEECIACDMPSYSYFMSPTEDYVIISKTIEGPKKEDGVYQVLTMDDRQPGWRSRNQLLKMDLNSGLVTPLTYGHTSVSPADISADGRYMLLSTSEERLEKRPTSVTSVHKLDLQTMQMETLIEKDGFLAGFDFVPGTSKIVVKGTPEAFNGIGKNLPAEMTPSMYDYQLFMFDTVTKQVEPVTKNFNPSIEDVQVSDADGMVYFTAQNADSVSIYRLNPKDNKITRLAQPCEVVGGFDISSKGNTLMYYGTSAVTSDRVFTLNTKTLKSAVVDDVNAERFAEVALGECREIKFKSKNGYDLTGFYYLPADFDPAKKYPVIVHYYGGCSPTSRRFGGGGHYPAHYWNALGYVVLISNPSGASGFGQEWAARHVNTMGEGVAEDIIETVQEFSKNSWVDKDKIGCVSASYGGFMTQLLLTKTDIFACGISHAGISDHTSYWGEGYWGYNYSEVSAANSYPWTRKDLFVDRSPLYNADKIHKPLLFTHGTADTNVPIGESIQMYTALKLLGRPTAFVMVEGENHGIMDYTKRQKWINTMVAWFDKYLKGDDSWWKAIYTPKEL